MPLVLSVPILIENGPHAGHTLTVEGGPGIPNQVVLPLDGRGAPGQVIYVPVRGSRDRPVVDSVTGRYLYRALR